MAIPLIIAGAVVAAAAVGGKKYMMSIRLNQKLTEYLGKAKKI
jgi:hypothetical protein